MDVFFCFSIEIMVILLPQFKEQYANKVKMKRNYQVGEVKEIRGKRAVVQIGTVPININLDDLVVIEEKQVTIICDDLPVLMIERSQFYQLFFNLIENAIKYRREDVLSEIKITAKSFRKKEKQTRFEWHLKALNGPRSVAGDYGSGKVVEKSDRTQL